MRRTSSVLFELLTALALLGPLLGSVSAHAQATPSPALRMLVSNALEPPPDDAPWAPVLLSLRYEAPAVWYRIELDVPQPSSGPWAIYLPYFYGGGRVLLNGRLVAHVLESGAGLHVRWERPHLLPLPDGVLAAGRNVLHLRAAAAHMPSAVWLPPLTVGPHDAMLEKFERRLFWMRTMPLFTVAGCLVVGWAVLAIWWRRPQEVLYGVFGLAALMWGARTTTFLIEVMPAPWWGGWRVLYHSATGGFIIAMTLFAMRLGGWKMPRVERALLVWWLVGPLSYILSGGNEGLVGRWWVGSLIPIGLGMLVLAAIAAWRTRSANHVALALGIALAFATGVHDYLLAWHPAALDVLAPGWVIHRIFLLHYGADVLLFVMAGILTARFIDTLRQLEQLNLTLEARVATRERELAGNYARLATLERELATDDERQRIMRDLHDGLGSQLFVLLSRVSRGNIDGGQLVQSLRDCIADMRLALEAMSPGSDFLAAWGAFRFRWESQLQDAGIQSRWEVDVTGDALALPSHTGLELMRIAQEALTNVLKHANASQVEVRLAGDWQSLRMTVADDGRGMAAAGGHAGRGLGNMRTRAQRLGGRLEAGPGATGTVVSFALAPADHASVPAVGIHAQEAQNPHAGAVESRPAGELAERLNAPVLKTGDVARHP